MNNRLIQCINGVCTRLGSTPETETPQYIAIANDREQKKNENEEK